MEDNSTDYIEGRCGLRLFEKSLKTLRKESKDYERKEKIYSYLQKRQLRDGRWINPINLVKSMILYSKEFLYTEKKVEKEKLISSLEEFIERLVADDKLISSLER